MNAPRTPSPKRARADKATSPANSPSASSTTSIVSELSIPESVKTANSWAVGTTSKRSFLKTASIWMFCAGLFFFTTESIRYAGKVINYGNVKLDPLDGTGEISLLSQLDQTHFAAKESEPSNVITATTKMKTKSMKSSDIETLVRGSTTRKTLTKRRLKMGKMNGGGRTTDLAFLNGDILQQSPGDVETTLQFQRVMTNVQVFQPGLGFLPQGTNIILAPGPRRGMGMGGKGGMGGMGSKGKGGGGRSKGGSIGRSKSVTFSPTFQPSSRPSSAPSSQPSSVPSRRPTKNPTLPPNSSLSPNTVVPTTLAPGTTALPTTLAPGTTALPTTLAPGTTVLPTTLAPGTTAAPAPTLAPGTTASPTTALPTLPPTTLVPGATPLPTTLPPTLPPTSARPT